MDNNDSSISNAGSTSSVFDISWIWGPARIYIVEFLVLYLALFFVLVVGINLFNEIINSATNVEANSFGALGALNPFDYDATISLVSMALVFTPAYGLLYLRTRKAERLQPKLKTNRRRRLIQYIFLSVVLIMALFYGVSLVNDSLSWVIYQSESNIIWQDLAKTLFAIGFLKLAFFMVVRNTEYATGSKS